MHERQISSLNIKLRRFKPISELLKFHLLKPLTDTKLMVIENWYHFLTRKVQIFLSGIIDVYNIAIIITSGNLVWCLLIQCTKYSSKYDFLFFFFLSLNSPKKTVSSTYAVAISVGWLHDTHCLWTDWLGALRYVDSGIYVWLLSSL